MSIDTVKESLSNLVSSGEINNKTQEELSDILYNFYLSLKYSNEHQNNNSVIVRTLSNDEYSKYLMNSTFGGSIVMKDENVFHFCDKDGASTLLYYLNKDYTAHDNKLYNNPNIYKRYTYGTGGNWFFGHFVFIYELKLNNKNNNCTLRKTKKSVLDIFDAPSTYNKLDIESSREVNKNFTGYFNQRTPKFSNLSVDPRYTCDILSGFRPIFQYLDNKKSTNIFS